MPPPDETSRPPHRRALGRGPGTRTPPTAAQPPEAPSPSAPAPEAASPAVHSGTAPEAASPAVPESVADDPTRPRGAASHPATTADTSADAPADSLTETAAGLAEAEPDARTDGPAEAAAGPAEEREPVAPGRGADARREVPEAPAGSGPGSPAEPDEAPGATGAPSPPGEGSGQEAGAGAPDDGRFTVRLANFEGPFDLLLQLISKHKLDVTEVALSKVTDEFMAHIRAMGPDWDLDQTTEFLVVAATLLDLKAARLLPAAEVEDEADLALLEARDLLFARLLQYRAYKQVASIFEDRWESEGRRYPRTVGLEAHHAELLPEVVISIGAEGFAKLAVKAMQPRAKPQVYVDHIHAPLVSVREQAGIVVALLRERGSVSFRELTDGAEGTLTVVARFLALLELYREKAVALDQEDALGELTVTWVGGERETQVTDEFDQPVEEKA
ncbi:segregation/condensation protein A [Streptomyces sp. NPDC047971]|uniref:segregation/condensation protein A n=1 Tax=Streptomyces sp. NPDC047971 TaxID=3154499 RepID=UPI0033DAC72E